MLTLLAFGLKRDVPDLDSSVSGKSMWLAREKLDSQQIPYEDLTDDQVKCAAWLATNAENADPVAGDQQRRHAIGLIRYNIHHQMDDGAMTPEELIGDCCATTCIMPSAIPSPKSSAASGCCSRGKPSTPPRGTAPRSNHRQKPWAF